MVRPDAISVRRQPAVCRHDATMEEVVRYALVLLGGLLLPACGSGFGSPPPPDALVIPEDCDDPEKRFHPEWKQLCGEWDD